MSSNKPGDTRPCVSAGLPAHEFWRVDALARRWDTTRANIVRQAVVAFCDAHDPLPDSQQPVKGQSRSELES